MSKILCTLAWYHDGGTLKPQLVLSCTPVTNLVMKGTDWKGARISNTNATAGARDRFEYSFTGGRSVTRISLVMNTSVILPPLVWLSKHPVGPPTKTGPRGKPVKLDKKEEARRIIAEEIQKIEDKKRRRSSPPHRSRQEALKYYDSDDEYDARRDRRRRLENRGYESPRDSRSHRPRSPESRRRDRHRRQESASSASSADSVREEYRRRRRERRNYARGDADAGEYAPDVGGGGDV
ncbi:hypothetical protein M430DRAFT_24665 [Amorphotheca resinae ATCC 22711]|uniref:Uncharacterized protein n=1 Tax=Amorphotheca resinae ATCC 22711 TaxID=857342 RepID=A0A2T3BG23_AMORE|nr:hypothetical protein M430DRAFT_24665 [Amorphotheca resinae ATCC 22711]PSS28324.1 hypothetical protein M430DRAFT_24665 [Amorphotheca resinae ATCC 22711]